MPRTADKRRRELEEGAHGIRKPVQPRLFSVAAQEWLELAQEWLELRKPAWSTRTLAIQKNSIAHLAPVLGKKLLVDIDAMDIAQYQKGRTKEGAASRSMNIEIGTLLQIMRKHGAWARIQSDVIMLPEREDRGRALSAEEQTVLPAGVRQIPLAGPAPVRCARP